MAYQITPQVEVVYSALKRARGKWLSRDELVERTSGRGIALASYRYLIWALRKLKLAERKKLSHHNYLYRATRH